jgi:hypothetical protein
MTDRNLGFPTYFTVPQQTTVVVVPMKNAIIWDVTLYRSCKIRRFGET